MTNSRRRLSLYLAHNAEWQLAILVELVVLTTETHTWVSGQSILRTDGDAWPIPQGHVIRRVAGALPTWHHFNPDLSYNVFFWYTRNLHLIADTAIARKDKRNVEVDSCRRVIYFCCLMMRAVADHIAWNDRMINKWWTGRDMEGNGSERGGYAQVSGDKWTRPIDVSTRVLCALHMLII